MNRTLTRIALMALIAALAGCGGGDNSSFAGSSGTGGSGTGSSSSSTGTGGNVISLGSGSGSSFQKGVLAIGVGSTTLAAGGSTSITANIVNADGSLYTQSVSVSFNSPCVSSGLASIVDATPGVTNPTSTVTTSTGTATATYTAKGCSSSDPITATAAISGATLTATASITVAAAELGSIQFVSATPATIALKGMGGVGASESSNVVFKVLDTTGGIKPGTDVTFSLNTTVGGVKLSTTTAKSDASGLVSTVVTSGTVAEPVSVIATVQGPNGPISTQSTGLAISGGIPSQKYFSLSVDKFNPEGFGIDGNTVNITARLGDRFGNPVPDGTVVSFNTRGPAAGGTVGNGTGGGGSCSTVNGACSVVWTSQNPRPASNGTLSKVGQALVMVYTAPGEEGFNDNNGDGVFDSGDSFTDQGEIYADAVGGAYQSGDNFFDYDQNGAYTAANGKWDGVNCQAGAQCGNAQTAVGGTVCIVMSGSGAIMSPSTTTVTAPGAVTFTISDENGNTLPNGTTITLVSNNVDNTSLSQAPATYKVGNVGCGGIDPALVVSIGPKTDTTKPATGSFYLEATTPGGTVTDSVLITINIP